MNNFSIYYFNMENEVLKKCPFCDQEPILFISEGSGDYDSNTKYYDIHCQTKGCYLELGASYQFQNPFNVIKLWNNRF